jgi:hypothetical protein
MYDEFVTKNLQLNHQTQFQKDTFQMQDKAYGYVHLAFRVKVQKILNLGFSPPQSVASFK